jgi:NADH-quinone oxidoreductase subunit K
MATLNDYLLVSGLLFAIGLAGVVLRRNIITPNGLPDYNGQMLVFFVITVAAAEVAVGLAIIVALYRARQTIQTNELTSLKG